MYQINYLETLYPYLFIRTKQNRTPEGLLKRSYYPHKKTWYCMVSKGSFRLACYEKLVWWIDTRQVVARAVFTKWQGGNLIKKSFRKLSTTKTGVSLFFSIEKGGVHFQGPTGLILRYRVTFELRGKSLDVAIYLGICIFGIYNWNFWLSKKSQRRMLGVSQP